MMVPVPDDEEEPEASGFGLAAGGAAGLFLGAAVGGPIGAVVGGFLGALFGHNAEEQRLREEKRRRQR